MFFVVGVEGDSEVHPRRRPKVVDERGISERYPYPILVYSEKIVADLVVPQAI